MSPRSRGRWKDGAVVPSTSMGAFPDIAAALRGFDAAAAEGDFNRFDAALCDGPGTGFLLELFAADASAFAPLVLTALLVAFADLVAAFRVGEVLGDFLRDFLDIRLPFVAFSGSIIGILRVSSGEGESGQWLGKSDGPSLTDYSLTG